MDRYINRLGAASRRHGAGQTTQDIYPNRPVRIIVPYHSAPESGTKELGYGSGPEGDPTET
jgi:hypothetical protein